MSDRVARRTALQFQLETGGYGVAPGSWAGTDCVMVTGQIRHKINRKYVDRAIPHPALGASEHLVAARVTECEFDVELAGSGTAGTAPPLDPLLRACGMARTVTAGNRVEYTPQPAVNTSSGALRYLADGALFVARGARGNFSIVADAFEIPKLRFKFMGYDTTASELSNFDPDFSAWKVPPVLTDANAGDLRFGATYNAGVVSGGTVLQARSLNVDYGNDVQHYEVWSGEAIKISSRETTGSAEVLMSAADEIAWRSGANANTTIALGFSYGTVAGNRVSFHAPKVQRRDVERGEYKGIITHRTDFRMLRNSEAGSDEMVLCFR